MGSANEHKLAASVSSEAGDGEGGIRGYEGLLKSRYIGKLPKRGDFHQGIGNRSLTVSVEVNGRRCVY